MSSSLRASLAREPLIEIVSQALGGVCPGRSVLGSWALGPKFPGPQARGVGGPGGQEVEADGWTNVPLWEGGLHEASPVAVL